MKNLEIVLKITFQFYNCYEDALNFCKKCKKALVFFWHFFKKMEYQGYKKMPKNAK